MDVRPDHLLLRIFINEDDRPDGGPSCRNIVEMLRERGLAGATVLKGIAGFGRSSRIHTGSILRLSEDLPIIIECVDETGPIEAIIPAIHDLVPGALITTEQVRVHTPTPDPA